MSLYPDADYLTGAYQPKQFYPDEGVEVAFAGRSNAGKSSAINTIVNRRNFARVSKQPGRTQLINFFILRKAAGRKQPDDKSAEQRIVDLPGYGFAKVVESMQKHWRVLITAYFEERQSIAGVFVIVDIRRGLGDYDRQMLDWAASLGCPAHVLLTKADKLKRGAAKNTLLKVRRELGDAATVQLFSALKRDGEDEARKVLDAMLAGEPPGKNPVKES
ncbi:MAG: YihA family ribosome biogenesis GTP-binding protein [Gammaproteobacteria bacterium]|nr:YihA family ribosome biogenesis GTP-binding protein [Gammaproteobacteria bacterium]